MSSKRKSSKRGLEEMQLKEMLFGKDITASIASTSKSNQLTDDESYNTSSAAVATPKWVDEDDDKIDVDLNKTDRLKKLKKDINSKHATITGTELSNLLNERFQTRKLKWAQSHATEELSETAVLLQTSGTTLADKKSIKSGALAKGKIDISRLVDANASDPSKEDISVVKFHSSGNMLMVGSSDKCLKFFKIDGDKNERLLSVKFNDMPISCASFLGNTEHVIVGGRKPYFYSYNTTNGNIIKVPGLMGKGLKSHENMAVSPDGSKIAFAGRGGYIHICCGKLKTWMMDLKMNTAVRALYFIDEETLVTSGLDAEVYIWDLRRSGRCIRRFAHDDGTCTSSIATCKSSYNKHYLAVGAESGIVSIFDENLSSSNSNSSTSTPTALKSISNLTTMIDTMSFHPSGQILAISSQQKSDSLRFIHLPSCTAYSNWPTERTPLRKVKCMDFSPGGAYFAAGNNRGRVLLYKLNKFGSS